MAAAGSSLSALTIPEAEDYLTCAVCHETYKSPKLLECTHTFCLQCLVDYVGLSPTFNCPMCRKKITVPSAGISAFRDNPYIHPEVLDKVRKTNFCQEHSTKELDLYCLPCDLPVCVLCLVENHEDHKMKSISEVAEQVRDQLAEDRERIKQAVSDIVKHVAEGKGKLENLQKKKLQVDKEIHNRHASLTSAIDKVRDEALASLESASTEIEKKFVKDLERIEENLKQLQKLQSTIQNATKPKASAYERVVVAKDMRCGEGSYQTVRMMALQQINIIARPVLRSGGKDDAPAVACVKEFMGEVIKLERRESFAPRKKVHSVSRIETSQKEA